MTGAEGGSERTLVHGTCVALELDGAWRGVLLRGPSGSGKSDLALRLIEAGWRLVADDQCALALRDDRQGGGLWVSAPEPIVGKIEARGLGIVALRSYLRSARLALVVDLVPADRVERVPEAGHCDLLGAALPLLALHAGDLSTPAKLRLALTGAAAAEQSTASAVRPCAAADEPAVARRRVVLVTGLSGAGRSTALNVLEDLGYEVVDNPPLPLVEATLDAPSDQPIALGIDIRTRNFAVAPFLELLDRLKRDRRNRVELLFLTCDEEVLARRFSETRRRHPLAQDRPLADGLAAERRMVLPLQAEAEPVIDTTALAPYELRRIIEGHFRPEATPGMSIVVMSFSYRLGLPRAADIVIDARFLTNPHYVPELKPLTGRDERVAAYVRSDPGYQRFYERLTDMLLPLVPRYEAEGKSYLTVAFGCTGGRHRSVALAEALAGELRVLGREVTLAHRDLERAKNEGAPLRDLA
jgi:RNase adaptor protein for sRNA GlmZ degradation